MCRQTRLLGLVTAGLLVWCAAAAAQEVGEPAAPADTPVVQKAATKPPRDLCRLGVDPYNPIAERRQFLAVAGVDNELDGKEFVAARETKRPFVRPFDRWKVLVAFDADADGTLDWFEADAYRRAVRAQVLSAFDANKNGRLTGEERAAANRALAAGDLPRAPARPQAGREGKGEAPTAGAREGGQRPGDAEPTLAPGGEATQPGRPDPWFGRILRQYDEDGDGRLNEAEREAAMSDLREAQRRQRLAEYDADGDGKLSREERQAARRADADPAQGALKRHRLLHFDVDGDGELNDEERKALAAFGRRARQMAEGWQNEMFDRNADGEVTAEERRLVEKEARGVAWRVFVRMWRAMDGDGDGTVSALERSAFRNHARERFTGWFSRFTKRFDADGDGRLTSPAERQALLAGIDAQFHRLVRRHDADQNGRLNGGEFADFMIGVGEEVGVLPAEGGAAVPAGTAGAPVEPDE